MYMYMYIHQYIKTHFQTHPCRKPHAVKRLHCCSLPPGMGSLGTWGDLRNRYQKNWGLAHE